MSYPPQPGYGAPGGYPPPGGGYPPPGGGYGPQPQQSNGLAIAALVVGIIGLFSCGSLSIFAIGLGVAGLSRASKLNGNGKGMAIGGIVTGVLGIIAGVVLLFTVVWAADQVDDLRLLLRDRRADHVGCPLREPGRQRPERRRTTGFNRDPVDSVCNVDRLHPGPRLLSPGPPPAPVRRRRCAAGRRRSSRRGPARTPR